MPFNGSGGFVPLSAPTYPAVAGEIIYAARFNANMQDLFDGLSNVVTRDGQSPATANLPMGGFKHTNVGDATGVGNYLAWGNPQAPIGGDAMLTAQSTVVPNLQVQGVGATGAFATFRFDASASAARVLAAKSRGVALGAHGLLQNGDVIAEYSALGSDGVKYVEGGRLAFIVSGTPGVDDMPTLAALQLTPDGSATPENKVLVYPAGGVVVGNTTPAFDSTLRLAKAMSGATTISLRSDGVLQTSATTLGINFSSAPSMIAGAYTLPDYHHYRNDAMSIGAGAALTSETGFYATGLSTGTLRYGVRSNVTVGAGRFNFYGESTAMNAFLGFSGFGTNAPGSPIDVVAENSFAIGVGIRGRVADDVGVLRWQNNANSAQQASLVGRTTGLDITTGSSGTTRISLSSTGRVAYQANAPVTFAPQVVTFGATPAFNCDVADTFELSTTLTANVTGATVTNLSENQRVEILVQQDGVGGRSFNFATAHKLAGTVGTMQNQISIASIRNLNGTILVSWSNFQP